MARAGRGKQGTEHLRTEEPINMTIHEYGKENEKVVILIHPSVVMRDFLMVSMGKIGGIRLLEKAFSADDYSEEDLRYVAKVLEMASAKTIWRTFDSCNN